MTRQVARGLLVSTILVFPMSSLVFLASLGPSDDALIVARSRVRTFSNVFLFPSDIELVVHPHAFMKPGTTAYTSRSWSWPPGSIDSSSGCILHFTPESVKLETIVAHEVCHCVLDFQYLEPGNGYASWVTRAMADEMETRARSCEAWLVDPSNEVDRERRARRIPVEWTIPVEWAHGTKGASER